MDIIVMFVLPIIVLTLLPMGIYALSVRPKLDIPSVIFFVLSLTLLFVLTPNILGIAVMIPWLFYTLLAVPQLLHWPFWIRAAVRKESAGVFAKLSPCLPLLACASVVSSVAMIPIAAYIFRILYVYKQQKWLP